MRISIFFMLFLYSLANVVAQDCTSSLSGRVLDYHNSTALVKATILITETQEQAFSDEKGNFTFNRLCDGNYELEVSHPSCTTQIIPITVAGNTSIEIRLEHHLEELEEVQVIGDAVPKKTNSAQEVTLTSETLEKYSTASLGEALRELGGVSSLNTGATIVKPTIHGLTGSRVLILNDGVRMQDMEWGDEHAPNVDINAVERVSLVKGASALKYGGDAIGGVILLEQGIFPVTRDTLFGKTLLNGVSNGRGGNISSSITKVFTKGWYLKGQGSYKRLGDQEAPDYVLSNTGIQEFGASLAFGKRLFEWGFGAKYAYYDAEIAILRASHIGNVDDLIRAINSGQPQTIEPFTYDIANPRQQVRHHLGKLQAYKRFEGLGKWSFQYDFQSNRRFEFDVRRGDRDDQAALDLELTTHTVTTDFRWDAKDDFRLDIGLLGRYQDNFANPATGVRRLIPDYERLDFGAFAIGEYRLNARWILDAGFRYDFTQIDAKKFYLTSRWEERGYDQDFADLVIEDVGTQLLTNPVFNYNNFSATTGVQFSKDNNSTFKFNYALSQRAPNPAELFSDGLHHSAARIELGDLRINSETSHKFSLSQEKNFKNWGFILEPYAHFVSNFILLEPTDVEFTIRGAFPVWGYRQTDVRLLGFDSSAYINWTNNWSTEHQFALVKGNDLDNDIALINIPAANLQNKLIFSKPEWNDLEVSLRSNYVFRQNETPPNIIVFSAEQQQEVPLAINTPPDAYHLFDFYGTMTFGLGDTATLTASLGVNNILNTTYREYLNRQRFFADDLGRNILLQLKLNY